MVIGKFHRNSTAAFNLAHALELPSRLPNVRPRAVIQRIADGIVADGVPVELCQLVFPVRIGVFIKPCAYSSADCARSIVVRSLA